MELSLQDISAVRLIQELDKSPLCVALTDLAAKVALPPDYVRRVMKALIQAGIAESLRGPGGGYALTRPARKITLADVIEAVPPGLSPKGPDATPEVARIQETFRRLLLVALSRKTVADL